MLNKQIESLQADIKTSVGQLEKQMADVRKELANTQQERDHIKQSSEDTHRSAQQVRADLEQLQQENSALERRAQDAEQKVSLLLDQVEHSVDNYRRQSRQPDLNGAAHNGGTGAGTHIRTLSAVSGADSVSETSLYEGGNRNSLALDSLANELETLRTHWETTNKNYRLSNAFDFEERAPGPGQMLQPGNVGEGLSGSLADWRKRLDDEEEVAKGRKGSAGSLSEGLVSPGGSKREMSPSGKEVGTGAGERGMVNLI